MSVATESWAMEISGLYKVDDKGIVYSIMPSYQWGNLQYFVLDLVPLPDCL